MELVEWLGFMLLSEMIAAAAAEAAEYEAVFDVCEAVALVVNADFIEGLKNDEESLRRLIRDKVVITDEARVEDCF